MLENKRTTKVNNENSVELKRLYLLHLAKFSIAFSQLGCVYLALFRLLNSIASVSLFYNTAKQIKYKITPGDIICNKKNARFGIVSRYVLHTC